MRRFIIILCVFIFSVFVGLKIAEDPGYAYFSYQQWSAEMPLWFVGIVLLLWFFVAYLLVRLSDGIDFSLYRWQNWLRWRRKTKAYSKTNRGLLELTEGNWKTAETYLVDGIAQSDAPLVNYLGAAKAAQRQGAFDKRDSYIRKAHDLAPHAEVVVGLTQAELLFEQGQYELALATITHVRTVAPKNRIALKLLERLYVHLGDWQELLVLLPALRKAKLLTDVQLHTFEVKVYSELLKTAKAKRNDLAVLWQTIPRGIQHEPVLIVQYVQLQLYSTHDAVELETLLVKLLKQEWNETAMRLYGVLETPHPSKQLAKAETWLKAYPNQAVLLLTLGRLSMRNQLWGKARHYFETSLKLHASQETYIEYGKLLEIVGEQSAAVQSYRDGLALAAIES